MSRASILRLAPLALLLVLCVSLTGAVLAETSAPVAAEVLEPAEAPDVAEAAVAVEAPSTVADGPTCSAAAGELGGGLVPLCGPTNGNGCSLSDIACAGFRCCCIYSCPAGPVQVGPCF